MGGFKFSAEIAPSARAKCKACKASLPKGQVRLGVNQVVDDDKAEDMDERSRIMMEAMKWYHPTLNCFGTFRKTAKWWLDNCPAAEDVVGLDDIDDDEKDGIVDVLNSLREGKVAAAAPKAKSKAKAKASPKKQTKKPSATSDDEDFEDPESGSLADDDEEQEPITRKAKKRRHKDSDEESPKRRKTEKAATLPPYTAASLSEEQITKIKDEMPALMKKNIAQLKEMLRMNAQILSGTKPDLVVRVAEGIVLGSLPKCPECGGGTLKWKGDEGSFFCPGYHDDGEFVRCKWTGDVSRDPWKSV